MFYGTKYINFQNNNKNPVKKVVVRRMGIIDHVVDIATDRYGHLIMININ